MKKRPFLSFILFSLMAVLSCSNAPGTSSLIGSSLFDLSENLSFVCTDYEAIFRGKGILLASGAVIKINQDSFDAEDEDLKIEKENEVAVPKKENSLIFGGAAFLLLGKA